MRNQRCGIISPILVAIAVIALELVGAGTASADPDVIGKQYGVAKGMLGQEGLIPVVATVMGGRMPEDECYVIGLSKVTARDSSGKLTNFNEVQVNLNCVGTQADKNHPGFSRANMAPEVVAARETHEEVTKAWLASDQGQKWCVKFEAQHPEWAPVPNCHPESDGQ